MKNKLYKIAATILLAAGLLGIMESVKSQEVVPQTQTILDGYFVTGNRPTQTNYMELIDTMFWYVNQTYSNSLAAAQSAAGVDTLYQGFANFTLSYSSTLTNTINYSYNISSIVVSNTTANTTLPLFPSGSPSVPTYECFLTFSNMLAGNNYKISFSSPACVTNFTSSTSGTGVKIDGFGATNTWHSQILNTTSCEFFLYTASPANLNGLQIVAKVE